MDRFLIQKLTNLVILALLWADEISIVAHFFSSTVECRYRDKPNWMDNVSFCNEIISFGRMQYIVYSMSRGGHYKKDPLYLSFETNLDKDPIYFY